MQNIYHLISKLSTSQHVKIINSHMNIFLKPKIKIGSYYILNTFEKFHLKDDNLKLVLFKFKPLLKSKCEKKKKKLSLLVSQSKGLGFECKKVKCKSY